MLIRFAHKALEYKDNLAPRLEHVPSSNTEVTLLRIGCVSDNYVLQKSEQMVTIYGRNQKAGKIFK